MAGTLVESRRRLPAQLNSGPTVLRQADDLRRPARDGVAGPATRCSIVLPLPIADAARLARPDLNPGIARFRIERIAVTLRELGSDRAARFLRADMRDCNVGNRDCGLRNSDLETPGNSDPGIGPRFDARARAVASGVGSCLDRNRREFGTRPKRFRRKHRLGKVEAEELVGTVLIRLRRTAPRQQHSANRGRQNRFQNHVMSAEMLVRTTPHVGSRQRKFKRKLLVKPKLPTTFALVDISGPEGISARRDGFGAMFRAATAWTEPLRIDISYITY